MDLHLFFRVLWRFRLLVLGGVVLAAALAFLSVAKVSFAGSKPEVTYRKAESWSAESAVFVTQRGFPWGRAIYPPLKAVPNATSPFADPGRLAFLAVYYARFMQSDAIRNLIAKQGAPNGSVAAKSGIDTSSGFSLPTVTITAVATDSGSAVQLANQAALALKGYIARQQVSAKIKPKERVVLQIINVARTGALIEPRKKTLPIVVFLSVLIATLGLCVVLENLRPRFKPAASLLREHDGSEAVRPLARHHEAEAIDRRLERAKHELGTRRGNGSGDGDAATQQPRVPADEEIA